MINVGWLLIVTGVIILAELATFFMSLAIPTKFALWYLKRFDRAGDVGVVALALAFTMILGGTILMSQLANGPVMISAVEFNEGLVEIVSMSILVMILMGHMAMQLKIGRVK